MAVCEAINIMHLDSPGFTLALPHCRTRTEATNITHRDSQNLTLALPHCTAPCEVVKVTQLDSQDFTLPLAAIQDEAAPATATDTA